MAKILLVAPDRMLADYLVHELKSEQHLVDVSTTAREARCQLHIRSYDVIVFDDELCDSSCARFCEQYRSEGGTARILALGEQVGSDTAAVLDAGGDECVTKPVEAQEFRARVRALLRRERQVTGRVLEYGDLSLDTVLARLTVLGVIVDLTPKEYAIINHFMKNPDRSFTPEAILDQVWKSSSWSSVATVRTHIRSLRLKLEASGSKVTISSSRGWGYKLTNDDGHGSWH